MIWIGLIFIFSSIHGTINERRLFHLDKLVHLIEYGVLSYLLYMAFKESRYKILVKYASILAIIIAIFYGSTDEFHQIFVHNRYCSIEDLLWDGIGAILAQIYPFSNYLAIKIQRYRKGTVDVDQHQ